MVTKTYEVTGVVIDKYDTSHYFRLQVEAASVDKAAKMAKSKLRVRRGDLLRDISIKEIR
ncbi:hypothetical protein [uncultured Mitsuokella sp.]|uniref:hypothetical protein n=1 Tax=uncultured Mitsuokella sp. TaxID=453120 RepID=UPI00262C72AA|nr:hypothetical protein [uncultured Mitsuokella sp.]